MPYSLTQFTNPDGILDYEGYVQHQSRMSKKKFRRNSVTREVIETVAKYIKKSGMDPQFALCHGSRNGSEQRWFRELLSECNTIGTEIGGYADTVPYTVQWDFHELKPEWVGAVDFIYSNSLDHAYDPQRAVTNWMRCLTATGRCFIEWWGDEVYEGSGVTDPFTADLDTFCRLCTQWGQGVFALRDMLPLTWQRPRVPRPNTRGGIVILGPIEP